MRLLLSYSLLIGDLLFVKNSLTAVLDILKNEYRL